MRGPTERRWRSTTVQALRWPARQPPVVSRSSPMSVDSSSVQWWPEFSSAPGESPPRRCDGQKRRSLQATGTPRGVERTGRRSSPPTPPTGSHHDRAPTTGSAALIHARNILVVLVRHLSRLGRELHCSVSSPRRALLCGASAGKARRLLGCHAALAGDHMNPIARWTARQPDSTRLWG